MFEFVIEKKNETKKKNYFFFALRKRTTLSMKHVWIYLIINYFYATNHISKRSEVDHKPKKVSMHWNNNEIRIIMKYHVNGIMIVHHG
jgi:hypothetical protein